MKPSKQQDRNMFLLFNGWNIGMDCRNDGSFEEYAEKDGKRMTREEAFAIAAAQAREADKQ